MKKSILILLVTISVQAGAAESFDGYWVSPQLSYAMKAKEAESFCARLKFVTDTTNVTMWPSVIRIENKVYTICDLTNNWNDFCGHDSYEITDGKLIVDDYESQFSLIGRDAYEIVSLKKAGEENKAIASDHIHIRKSESDLKSVNKWAQECKLP